MQDFFLEEVEKALGKNVNRLSHKTGHFACRKKKSNGRQKRKQD